LYRSSRPLHIRAGERWGAQPLKLLSKRLADPHTVSLARLPAISTDECTVLQHGAPFRLREPVLFCVFLRHPEVLSVHQTHIESAQSDKARFARVDDGALIPWIDEEVRSLWGVKAAVRVLGIATKGWDVKPVGAIANRRPSEIRTNRVSQVPGSGHRSACRQSIWSQSSSHMDCGPAR
jgi:hypothetical protein